MTTTTRSSALRTSDGAGEVTNIELFFDLVYVFAVTQLAHFLGQHHTADGAVETAVLLAMVWQIWVYTTWAVNYLDPNRFPARAMLVVLMLGSLVLAAGIPYAFADRALLIAGTYVAMQAGRALFVIVALRGERLQVVFVRILPWTTLSGAVMLSGAAVDGHAREALWATSVAIDLIGAALGFYVPGLGRSETTDWTISGSHFAERCQAFVLIALGESIIVIGGKLDVPHADGHNIAAFVTAFAGAVGLWWIYFDRAAEDSAREIASSPDPGRLARNAFHWIHPVIVGGIIVEAAAGERLFEHPAERGDATFGWLLLGGIALFLAGHALFKAVVWRLPSWPRLGGIIALGVVAILTPHVARLTLAICSVAVIVGVAIIDRVTHPIVASVGGDDVQGAAQGAEDVR
ncbi:MAG TPA: low temperature requirement protein A [Casimicrobiaceae bacterium]|nr:low temperature requirement protein A [Casimicrobiaceae bacterium]